MTIVDAARTGRRFKRPKSEYWCHVEGSYYGLSIEDLLATDWQIEEPKPKRRLYVSEGGSLTACDYIPNHKWKPLSKAEFEELFND